MRKAIVCYVPVLHEGYRKLFASHPDARELFLFGEEVIGEFEHLAKDIRRLDPKLVQSAIASWGMFDRVEILDAAAIQQLQDEKVSLIVSNDDITTELVEKYFKDNPVAVDSIFLRWDKKKSIVAEPVSPDVTISKEEFDRQMMAIAHEEGLKSPDWWRQLGVLAVRDGKILLQTHNTHVPSDQITHDEGDPRGNFSAGVNLESSLVLHGEASLIVKALREGVSLKDADVYVETFPCPPCAKLLAYSGIKRMLYRVGYKVLDGERILRSQGVEIVFVDIE